MQNNDISKLNDIHDLDELQAIREAHRQEEAKVAEAIKQAEARIREERRAVRRNEEQKFRSKLVSDLYGLYSLSHRSCEMIADRVWEDHHSGGTQEVTNAAYSLADFVEQIVKDEYQNKYWR